MLEELDVLSLMRCARTARRRILEFAGSGRRGTPEAKTDVLDSRFHYLDYQSTNARLPAGVELSYDGLRIPTDTFMRRGCHVG